jgi:hypothetical protein
MVQARSRDGGSAGPGDMVLRHSGASPPGSGLLCVTNFATNAGFAWNYIEGLYAGIADRLAPYGSTTWWRIRA